MAVTPLMVGKTVFVTGGTGGVGNDLYVGVVVLDSGPNGLVALVAHVVQRVMEHPADLALAADRPGQHIGRLFARLTQVVNDRAHEVDALLVTGRHIRQEHQLGTRLLGRSE